MAMRIVYRSVIMIVKINKLRNDVQCNVTQDYLRMNVVGNNFEDNLCLLQTPLCPPLSVLYGCRVDRRELSAPVMLTRTRTGQSTFNFGFTLCWRLSDCHVVAMYL